MDFHIDRKLLLLHAHNWENIRKKTIHKSWLGKDSLETLCKPNFSYSSPFSGTIANGKYRVNLTVQMDALNVTAYSLPVPGIRTTRFYKRSMLCK
jgi:hypothetical protein